MINTDRELEVTKHWLQIFREDLKRLDSCPEDARIIQTQKAAVCSWIKQMEAEIIEYEHRSDSAY